ncbi:MAG TPA: YtfJ family protein [Bacteroidales bacterium]|nr:YtfJ family protein [Bacteroidales bacterium]HPJ58968.1 YtfJ family protein [Bacteroidales bacterium]HPR12030.1 YtfJ family protein [Bacteroidales bacterium]HRW86287.1 YtfJ family protein [Bacteroidales bacterium]
MKKAIFSIFLILATVSYIYGQSGGKLEIGQKAPEWVFTDADKKEFSMDSWPDKVLQINYVDPDESDLNDPFNDAIDKATDVDKRINKDFFKGFGIVDCKSTWKPNGLIRMIAGNKAKKYDTTILFDYDGVLQRDWGMPKDSYSVVIVDKNRVVRAVYKGLIPESEHEKIIQMIIELTRE